MEDIKILQEELRTKTRANTRPIGFSPKSGRRIIRFKLVDLDFSLKLGDIQDIKTRPLFFSVINGSDAKGRRNGRQICDFLSKRNYKTTADIGDGDSRIISGDLTTKMLGGTVGGWSSAIGTGQREREEIKYGNGEIKTIPQNVQTRMPRSLRSLAVRTLSRNLLPGYVTPKMADRTPTAYFTPCTLRSSAAETLSRNLIPGDVTTKMHKKQGETVATYFTPCTLRSSAAGTLYRNLNAVRPNGQQGIVDEKVNERSTNIVDKMKVENFISATQVKPTSSGTIPAIDTSDGIIRHRCQDTKDIVDVNTSNSTTVSSAMTEHRHFSDKSEEQETPKPKKRQNILKKFWKRITGKSKNKTENKTDEQINDKKLKKSSKLTSLMCLCHPKTMD